MTYRSQASPGNTLQKGDRTQHPSLGIFQSFFHLRDLVTTILDPGVVLNDLMRSASKGLKEKSVDKYPHDCDLPLSVC